MDYTDLKRRLARINRDYDLARGIHSDIREAAAAIAALEAEVARLRSNDARRFDCLVDALTAWDDHNKTGDMMQGWWVKDARAALADQPAEGGK